MNFRVQISCVPRGFTLIELMIVMLLISALGVGLANYMKRSTTALSSSDSSEETSHQQTGIQNLITEDLQQAVFLNPSCDETSGVAADCDDIKVRGGITPLPGLTKDDVEALTSFALPASWNEANSTLNETTDAIRLIQFDFEGPYNCRLNRDHLGANPSTTAGNAVGAERFWAKKADASISETACDGKLTAGGLYVMMEEINGAQHANLFQITALSDLGTEFQVDVASSGNLFNQVGGLGRSGFTAAARIYPVKFVEWARDSSGGLHRREIIPSAGNTGYQAWVQKAERVDALHFSFLTFQFLAGPAGSADPKTYQRTLFGLSTNDSDDHIEDIRGVGTRLVVRSAKSFADEAADDNPATAAVENDGFARRDVSFFVQMRNRTAGGS